MGKNARLSTALAAAAAVAFSTSVSATSPDFNEKTPRRVKCQGANKCKGQSSCQTITTGADQNACKGQGWLFFDTDASKTAEEKCKDAGGTVVFD